MGSHQWDKSKPLSGKDPAQNVLCEYLNTQLKPKLRGGDGNVNNSASHKAAEGKGEACGVRGVWGATLSAGLTDLSSPFRP